MPKSDLSAREVLLLRAQEYQSLYWDALSDLEAELGIEINGLQELEGMTCEDLIELAQEEEEGK